MFNNTKKICMQHPIDPDFFRVLHKTFRQIRRLKQSCNQYNCVRKQGNTKAFVMVKACFYISQYPVRWSSQITLQFTRWQTCSFRHQLDFSGKHARHAVITTRKDNSLTFPPLYIARYSFIQLSELGAM